MKKKLKAAFFSATVVAGIVTAVGVIHRFPIILVGLVVLAIFCVIYDIVYRNME